MIYPWHTQAWQALDRSRLPHALLIHGAAGIGKTHFLFELAYALLCESSTAVGGFACGQCAACGWIAQSNHPDLLITRPESLEKEATDSKNPTDPKSTSDQQKKEKNKSREIRIEQIRELIAFTYIGKHRAKNKIFIVYPLESLNLYSANALLKTLEEPPPETVFLLLAHNLDNVLPTILSRCQRIFLPQPTRDEALAWLKTQGVRDEQGSHLLQQMGGAPLEALRLSQNIVRQEMHTTLIEDLKKGREIAWLNLADSLYKYPIGEVLQSVQRWVYDLLSLRLAQKIRYHSQHEINLKKLATKVEPLSLLKFIRDLEADQKRADHPLSPKLVLENCFIDYSHLFLR